MPRRLALSVLVVLSGSLSLQPSTAAEGGAWTPTVVSGADLNDVSFSTESTGYAVGAGGTILATQNGGGRWVSQTSGTDADLNGVDFVDGRHGWAVGAGDTVLTTANGGARWVRTATGTGAVLEAVDFVDQRHGWAVGLTPTLSPVIVATSDGGRTWVAQPSATVGVGLLAVSFVDSTHGMAVGYAGSAYRTSDGGSTWVPMVVGVGVAPTTVDTFHSVQMLTPTDAVVGSFQGFIYRTRDGGLTWSVRGSLGRSVLGLASAGFDVIAAGTQGLVARSPDGGESWSLEVSGTSEDLRGASAPSPASAWLVGSHGSVVRFSTPAPPVRPLRVSEYRQSCGGLGIEWIHRASGLAVDAVSGDLLGHGRTEIVLAGPEGVWAVRPFAPTGRATLWALRFQTAFQQLALAELDGDRRPEIVAVSARSPTFRSGILALEAESGRVAWSRTIPGGAQIVRPRDLDRDGLADLVVLGNDQAVHLLSGRTGRDLRAPVALGDYGTDIEVGDLIGEGSPAVVATLRNGSALAFDAFSGERIWRYRPLGEGGSLRAVVLSDLDGDRVLDVLVGGNGQSVSLTGAGAVGNTTSSTPGALVVALEGSTARRLWDLGEAGPSQVNALVSRDLTGDGIGDVVAQISRLSGSHTMALDGLGRRLGSVPTGEPLALWDVPTSGGTGLDLAFTPDELILADGTGDGQPDAYEALLSGRFLAIGGVPSGPGPTRLVPAAPKLWEAAREIPGYHVSWVRAGGNPYVLTLSGDSLVSLRRPESGEIAWSFDAGGRAALGVGDMTGDGQADVAVGHLSGRAFGLDASGSALSPSDHFLPGPVAAVAATDVNGDGRADVVAGSSDGLVQAFDPVTNRVRWTRRFPFGITSLSAGSGTVAVGRADGVVDGLDQRTGKGRWSSTPAPSGEAPPVSALTFLASARMFAAGDTAGTIRLLSGSNGKVRVIPIGSSPTGGIYEIAGANLVGDRRLEIAVASGSTFHAYTLEGTRLWTYRAGSFATRVEPIDLNGDGRDDVVGTSWDGNAYGLAGATGRRMWTASNGQPAGVARVRSAGGRSMVLLATAWDDGFAGVRLLTGSGKEVGSCRLRKTPYGVDSISAPSGAFDAMVSTEEGDVYRIGP